MQATSSRSPFTPDERRIVHFTGFGHAATHFVELVYPTLAIGLAAETGVPIAEVLSWSFAGYLLFGLGALPAGIAADRLGARRVILAGLLGAGLSALAASRAAPGWPLAICLAGLGASASFYHPAGTGLLSHAVVARGKALGINGIYGNLGIALAPLTTAALASQLGWRMTIGLTGATLVGATLALSRLRVDDTLRADSVQRADAVLSTDDVVSTDRSANPISVEPDTDRATSSNPTDPKHADPELSANAESTWTGIAPFLVMCLTATLGGFAYRANTLAQPALFAEEISFMGYGLAASLAMAVGIAGQYIGGALADNRELRSTYLAFHLLSLLPLGLVAFTTNVSLLVVSALYVFFALGMQPIENSLFALVTPARWRSTAYGLKFVLTFGIGSTAVWMVHFVAETDGWPAVYWVLVGVVSLLVTFIGVLFIATRRSPMHNSGR